MDLGKYSKAESENDIVWVNTVDDGWTIPMGGVQFRDQPDSKLHIKSEQITLDTGLTYVMAPPDDLEEVSNFVRAKTNITCAKEGGSDIDFYECDCTKEQYAQLHPL